MDNPKFNCIKCGESKSADAFYIQSRGTRRPFTKCKSCHIAAVALYRNKVKDSEPERIRRWEVNGRPACYRAIRKYKTTSPKQVSPEAKLTNTIRKRICQVLRRGSKAASSIELLGCTVRSLKEHLESLFREGMTWESYGVKGWHVDHIMPCASFDLTDPEQQRRCFHYTNLQPLWALENLKKGARTLA